LLARPRTRNGVEGRLHSPYNGGCDWPVLSLIPALGGFPERSRAALFCQALPFLRSLSRLSRHGGRRVRRSCYGDGRSRRFRAVTLRIPAQP